MNDTVLTRSAKRTATAIEALVSFLSHFSKVFTSPLRRSVIWSFSSTAWRILYQAWSVYGNKLWDIQTRTTSFTSERAYRHNALIFIRSTLYASPSKNFLLIPESERSHFLTCDLFSRTSIMWVKELTRTISPGPVCKSFPKARYRDSPGDTMTSLAR